MISFWKLLNFEVKRLALPFAAMILLTGALQFFGVYSGATQSVEGAHRYVAINKLSSLKTYVEMEGPLNIVDMMNNSIPLFLSIMICIAFLLFYVLFGWYRDCLGRQSFISRLLVLPTARHSVYLAKLIALLLVIFGMLAVQSMLLPLENRYYDHLVPDEISIGMPIDMLITTNPFLRTIMPISPGEFLLYYGMGIVGVIVIYTCVMLERSYRLRGIAGGIVYGGAALYFVTIPIRLTDSWYPDERLKLLIAILIAVGGLSYGLSVYLLKRKITV